MKYIFLGRMCITMPSGRFSLTCAREKIEFSWCRFQMLSAGYGVRQRNGSQQPILRNMKVRYALLAMAAMLTPLMAAEQISAEEFAKLPGFSAKRLTGSFTVGYDTNYVGRGLVISHSVAEGDSSELAALKLNYDVGHKQQQWSIDSTISYRAVSSGHTMYGSATYAAINSSSPVYVRPRNVENEFAVLTAVKYSGKKGRVSLGHEFVHGGLLGAFAKHFRQQSASCVNEVYLETVWTPTKWAEVGHTLRLSFQGVQGWWFEPYVTFKAPIIGDPEHMKLAGVVTFAMSATANYFDEGHHANANGAQAFWIKLATPYFATKRFIITPAVSFNWLGAGAQKAARTSLLRYYTGDSTLVPYRNFGVVGSVTCTYLF